MNRHSLTRTLGLAAIAWCIAAPNAATSQTFTLLHEFDGTKGSLPFCDPLRDAAGNLYGTCYSGGDSDRGTVWKLKPNGQLQVLKHFSGLDGANPESTLVMDPSGNVYGTTLFGGTGGGYGTVFKISSNGTFTTLKHFNGMDGSEGTALAFDKKTGNLLGTTFRGGDLFNPPNDTGAGTIFRIKPNGAFTMLHSFSYTDGYAPFGRIQVDGQGNLFGGAWQGGAIAGVIWKLPKNGTLQILHDSDGDGYNFIYGPKLRNGELIGTAGNGGEHGYGSIFKIDTGGTFHLLHSFDASVDGAFPYSSVAVDKLGNIFGTTKGNNSSGNYGAGDGGFGTVYKRDAGGTLTTLHTFSDTDGANPFGGVLKKGKNLFGTCTYGGASGLGVIYKIVLP